MTDWPRSEFKPAFVETGLLVAGGIAGGGLSYLLVGDNWIVNAVCAVAGAWLVAVGARRVAGNRGMER